MHNKALARLAVWWSLTKGHSSTKCLFYVSRQHMLLAASWLEIQRYVSK